MAQAWMARGSLRWMTAEDYIRVFREDFTVDLTDPEILLITGSVYRDGRIDVGPSYRLSSGLADEPNAPGEFAVQVLDSMDRILSSTGFDASFNGVSEVPGMPDTIEAVPFGVKLPFPVEAATVQVTRTGRTLVRFTIATKVLRDAVMSIPDAGFVKDPPQQRNALLNQIDAFDRQLSAQAARGTRQRLLNDIRKLLNDWLIDGYATETPLQHTKKSILDLVDELLLRLRQ